MSFAMKSIDIGRYLREGQIRNNFEIKYSFDSDELIEKKLYFVIEREALLVCSSYVHM